MMAIVSSPMKLTGVSLLIIGLWTFPIVEGWTTLYKCLKASGTTIFTDSPAQLTKCEVIASETVAPQVPQSLTPGTGENERSYAETARQPAFPDSRYDSPEVSFEQEQTVEISPNDEAAPATIPLTRIGDSMLVQVLLNRKQQAHLIVDTGASMTVLSYDLAIELGLLSGSEVSLDTVNTAGGAVQVNRTHVEEIRAGSAVAHNVSVAIHDLPNPISGVSGLLGMSFLNQFKVTLDAEREVLRLDPRK